MHQFQRLKVIATILTDVLRGCLVMVKISGLGLRSDFTSKLVSD